MLKRLILALAVTTTAAVANAAIPKKAAADCGWAYVCCGAMCETDKCEGKGNQPCCKDEG